MTTTTSTRASDHSGYEDVDGAADPADYIRRLDTHARSPFWQDLKLQSYQLLELRPGDVVLDVGCGTGDDARALASFVAPGGRVVGVDCSEVMLAEARRRSAPRDLSVEFVAGRAEHLEFPAQTFDACRVERVLQHVDNPADVLNEMLRVCRHGARVVAIEPDYGSLRIMGAEGKVTERIVEHRCAHFQSGRVGRELPSMFIEARLWRVRVGIKTLATRRIDPATHVQLVKLADAATDANLVTEEEAHAWLAQLAQAEKDRRFQFATNIFIVGGHRA